MHFVAIAMPKKQLSFDGRLFFEPRLREVKENRISSNRKSGTTYLQPVAIDDTKFSDFIIKALKATVQKLPDATSIRIIADDVGGHSVGKHGQKGLDGALRNVRQWISLNSVQDLLM